MEGDTMYSNRATLAAATAASFLLVSGCHRTSAPREDLKSEVTDTTNAGKTVTKTEATTVGSTLVQQTTTTARGSEGSERRDTTTYIGTVSAYEAGRSIDIMTGENVHHRVDLSEKNSTLQMDPSITVGNKVRLVESKDGRGQRTVTVTAAG
jgi:hypothetical protein